MFSGSYDHVLDEKGRTSLPKEFREALSRVAGVPWLTGLPHCLAIYPDAEYDTIQRALAAQSKVNASVQRVQRLITGLATRCPFDRQGRILIPPKAREWAGLSREIVFTGVGGHIEIWDRGRHQAELERIREHYDDYTRDLKEFGV
jgi:MraZ protein